MSKENTTYNWDPIRLTKLTDERTGDIIETIALRLRETFENVEKSVENPVEKLTSRSMSIPKEVSKLIEVWKNAKPTCDAERHVIAIALRIFGKAEVANQAYAMQDFLKSPEARKLFEEFQKKNEKNG